MMIKHIYMYIYLFFFLLVHFPGHPGQTSPPNPIDKVSNLESSHSGFSVLGKIESSKVGHAVLFHFSFYVRYIYVFIKDSMPLL